MMEIELKKLSKRLCEDIENFLHEKEELKHAKCIPTFNKDNNFVGVKTYNLKQFKNEYSFAEVTIEVKELNYSDVDYNKYLENLKMLKGVNKKIYIAKDREVEIGQMIKNLNDNYIYVDEGKLYVYDNEFEIEVTDVYVEERMLKIVDFFYNTHKFDLDKRKWN